MRPAAMMYLALVLLAGCSTDHAGPSGTENPPATGVQKIDPPLRAAMGTGARVPVLILGSRQLIPGPNGFRDFTERNAGADRLVQRAAVIAELRTLAEGQRSALRDPSWPAAARALDLWLVNAVAAELTRSEIERAATRSDVAYLYLLDGALPPATASGTPTTVASGGTPFSTQGRRIAWNVERIGAPAAWREGVTGEGTVVALIDVGVVLSHPDLASHIWTNVREVHGNGVDDDGNGYVDDRHGYDFGRNSPDVGRPGAPHGTFVAGILAGDGTAGTITGVAPRARIMPLVGFGFAEVALAFQYAAEHGADVVNMSFSIPNLGNLRGAWRMMADHAVAAGLVLVSGAGNFRQTASVPVQLRVPEDIPSVLAAGGVLEDLSPAPFSSMGPVEWGSVRFYGDHPMSGGLTKPDVVAFPGAGYPLLDPAGGYVDPNPGIRGNSFSGPQVAGAAALLLSAHPGLPAWRVGEVLQETARDLGAPGKDSATGAGLIDIAAALRSLR